MLLDHLRETDGFTLSLAWVADEATANSLIDVLRERLSCPPIVLDARQWPDDRRFLEWMLASLPLGGVADGSVCLVTGIAGVDFRRHPLHQLNANRNTWMRAAPCHWVLLLPPYEQLRAQALDAGEAHFSMGSEMPDVYSIRSGDYVFEAEAALSDSALHYQRKNGSPLPASGAFEEALSAVGSLLPITGGESASLYARAAVTEFQPFLNGAVAEDRYRIEDCLQLIPEDQLPEVLAARVLAMRAMLLSRSGAHSEAARCANRSLDLADRALASGLLSASTLQDLSWVQDTLSEARPDVDLSRLTAMLQRLIRATEEQAGSEAPLLATNLSDLAGIYYDLGQDADAEPLYCRALTIGQQSLGAEHPFVVTWLNNLALLYSRQGRSAEAEPLYRRALAISAQRSEESPETAVLLNNLARLCARQGRFAEAEQLYRRARKIWEPVWGVYPQEIVTLFELALVLTQTGRVNEAEPLVVQAVRMAEQTSGPDDPELASGLEFQASVQRKLGKFSEAEAATQRAQEIRSKNRVEPEGTSVSA